MQKKTETYRTDWNGHLLEIQYEPLWMPAHVTGGISRISKSAASLRPTPRCRSQEPASTDILTSSFTMARCARYNLLISYAGHA